jgi:hypothetical protein
MVYICPSRLIIRCFELSDKTDSKTNFEQAIRGSVRRASGLVLADDTHTSDLAAKGYAHRRPTSSQSAARFVFRVAFVPVTIFGAGGIVIVG